MLIITIAIFGLYLVSWLITANTPVTITASDGKEFKYTQSINYIYEFIPFVDIIFKYYTLKYIVEELYKNNNLHKLTSSNANYYNNSRTTFSTNGVSIYYTDVKFYFFAEDVCFEKRLTSEDYERLVLDNFKPKFIEILQNVVYFIPIVLLIVTFFIGG